MIDRLLYKFNGNALCLAMFLLLVVVSAIPVPSMISFKSLEKELSASRERLFDLKNRNAVVAGRKKRILGEWKAMAGVLDKRFEGLTSPLALRNMILDLSVASGLQPALCFYRDAKRMINREGLEDYGARDICTARIETEGTGGIAEILTFLRIIEELQIGIRLRELSIRKPAGFSDDFIFSMKMDGFYVYAGESETPALPVERR